MGIVLPGKVEDALEELFKPTNVEALTRVIQRAPVLVSKVETLITEGQAAVARVNRAAERLEGIIERVQAAVADPS